jgi:transcription-repair coupling factor (superfamily II helicase)
LLIVDEEQRFGVEHKEKIKELKNSIDVLTLSATPIPRTMQMSLIGIRSLAQLTTPPLKRMPIQTYVTPKNPRLIKEVIEREIGRGGQVFYLHNNTSDLNSIAFKIEHEIKGSKVGIIHGKMPRELIEETTYDFYNNKINVLVSTTIIETGIDIPNANTMIIENADRFGLSQLYQIKGRVGRSDRIAYAYLLYNPKKSWEIPSMIL